MKNTIIDFPKTIPLFSSPKVPLPPILVPVEFKKVDDSKCTFETRTINNYKHHFSSKDHFSYKTNFGRNFFQTFRNENSGIDETTNDFFLNIGRAISFGLKNYKKYNKNGYTSFTNMGGLLSPIFNAKIKDDGKIFVNGEEYKLVILYSYIKLYEVPIGDKGEDFDGNFGNEIYSNRLSGRITFDLIKK